MTVRSAHSERDEMFRKTTAPLAECIERIAAAVARGDEGAHARALAELAGYLHQVLEVCSLLGARRALLLADAAAPSGELSAEFGLWTKIVALVPRVPFLAAIRDMLSREPRLERSYKELSRLYSEERAFGLAKSADIEITKRIQAKVVSAIEDGGDRGAVRRAIMEIGAFSDDYADNVFRTNAATAYSAGTFVQSQDEDVAAVMPAFQFTTANDADVRPHHRAAHGLVAATHDPIWDTFAPPIGWRCRCGLDLVSKITLRKMGLWDEKTQTVIRRLPANFAQARPDEGFTTGPIGRRFG